MFDVDEHPDVDAAIRDAAQVNIGIAVSNPCVELWFLLHWRDQTAHLDRHAAQSAVVPLVGATKSLHAQAVQDLIIRHEDAANRARKLHDPWTRRMVDANGADE